MSEITVSDLRFSLNSIIQRASKGENFVVVKGKGKNKKTLLELGAPIKSITPEIIEVFSDYPVIELTNEEKQNLYDYTPKPVSAKYKGNTLHYRGPIRVKN